VGDFFEHFSNRGFFDSLVGRLNDNHKVLRLTYQSSDAPVIVQKEKMKKKRRTLLVLVLLFSVIISGCGTKHIIRGSVKDDCSDTQDLAKGATISLGLQIGDVYELWIVDNEWRGKTAAVKVDSSGIFEFKNVPDGIYGIYLLGVLVADGKGNPFFVEMKDGKSQDVGIINLNKNSEGNCIFVLSAEK